MRTLAGQTQPRLLGATALALVVALSVPSSAARAQSVNLCVEEMSDEQIEAHTARIVGELRDHRRHARGWRFGWLTAYTGIAAVALGVLAPGIGRNATDPDDQARRMGYIGAGIGATVAAMRLAFYPMPDVWGVRRIERMPTSTRRERIQQTQYAESVLTSAGAWQGLMTGASSYAIAIGWGLGWGGHITRQYNAPSTAALAFVGSPVLGIATALTAPSWAAVSAARIRGGVCGHTYVEDVESLMDDVDAGEVDDDFEYEDEGGDEADGDGQELADELDDAGAFNSYARDDQGPTVMVYPTLGGAGLLVNF